MCSISNDGTSVISGGKAVHARSFGSGGSMYNIFIDTTLNPVSIGTIGFETPTNYLLKQNYPNPFNAETVIMYAVKSQGNVSLKLYSIEGKEISSLFEGFQSAGTYELKYNAGNLPSGVYFYTLSVNGYNQTRRMVMTK